MKIEQKLTALIAATMFLLPICRWAEAGYSRTRVATVTRFGDQYDEYVLEGDAALSESQVFADGIQLAAWDASEGNAAARVAIASAVYFFAIPSDTVQLAVEIGYQGSMAPPDKRFAGYLFVRNPAVEETHGRRAADTDIAAGQPAFYGNTYTLPADDTRNIVYLQASDCVVDGILELHISADAGRALDVDYIKVTAYTQPITMYRETVVETIADPYFYTYRYYYAGPWCQYRTGTFITFSFSTGFLAFDPVIIHGWWLYRSHFVIRHRWICRPRTSAFYTVIYRPHHHRRNGPPHHPAWRDNEIEHYRRNWRERHFTRSDYSVPQPVRVKADRERSQNILVRKEENYSAPQRQYDRPAESWTPDKQARTAPDRDVSRRTSVRRQDVSSRSETPKAVRTPSPPTQYMSVGVKTARPAIQNQDMEDRTTNRYYRPSDRQRTEPTRQAATQRPATPVPARTRPTASPAPARERVSQSAPEPIKTPSRESSGQLPQKPVLARQADSRAPTWEEEARKSSYPRAEAREHTPATYQPQERRDRAQTYTPAANSITPKRVPAAVQKRTPTSRAQTGREVVQPSRQLQQQMKITREQLREGANTGFGRR